MKYSVFSGSVTPLHNYSSSIKELGSPHRFAYRYITLNRFLELLVQLDTSKERQSIIETKSDHRRNLKMFVGEVLVEKRSVSERHRVRGETKTQNGDRGRFVFSLM